MIGVVPTHYSYKLIEESGVFVINFITEDYMKEYIFLGTKSGKDTDKYAAMNIKQKDGDVVKVPILTDCAEALRMLRIAPASTNSQPWRALVKGDEVIFYYKPKSPASLLDTGIGICHFYETEKYNGFEGSFNKESDFPTPPADWRYLISYIR